MLLSSLYAVFGSFYLITGKKKQENLTYADRKILSLGLLSLMIFQNLLLFLYDNNIYIALAFIFLFYCYGGFIPVYLRYKTDMSALLIPGDANISYDTFCRQYEISKREKEIIHEICNGLSNQQIADKLFISLQTVKDHTHRIYGKTNCTGRTQLIRMVNESVQQ